MILGHISLPAADNSTSSRTHGRTASEDQEANDIIHFYNSLYLPYINEKAQPNIKHKKDARCKENSFINHKRHSNAVYALLCVFRRGLGSSLLLGRLLGLSRGGTGVAGTLVLDLLLLLDLDLGRVGLGGDLLPLGRGLVGGLDGGEEVVDGGRDGGLDELRGELCRVSTFSTHMDNGRLTTSLS